MSGSASKFQEKFMVFKFRGKEIFKPLNTGMIDSHVKCICEFIANIFFYAKNGTIIMINAGYNYECPWEKMEWIGIDQTEIQHILFTHQDTDHVGAVARGSDGLFRDATLYIGEVENRYLTKEVGRHKKEGRDSPAGKGAACKMLRLEVEVKKL